MPSINQKLDSHDLEALILGSMINSKENLDIASRVLQENDFLIDQHRLIFKTIKEADKEKGSVDTIILAEALKRDGGFDDIEWYGRLMELSNQAGISAHIKAYCDDLKQITTQRSLIQVSEDIINDVRRGIEPETCLERVATKIEDIKKNKPNADSLFRHLLDPLSEDAIREETKKISAGAKIGFKIGEVDLVLPGGAISIVAGPTGHGKTLTMINFSLGYLENNPNKEVVFFSYEESRSAIAALFLNTYVNEELSKNNRSSIKSYFREAQGHEVDFFHYDKRTLFTKKKNAFFDSYIKPRRLNIHYCDYSIEELVMAMRFIKKNSSAGLIAIDYIQLLRLMNKKGSLQRQEELKHICLMLKDCAVETGLPILLGAQFNREVDDEKDLSPYKIGEAGDIERAANLVLGIWNRQFLGFEGKRRNGNEAKEESSLYMEILKGREIGIGHNSIFILNKNSGRLIHQNSSNINRPIASAQDIGRKNEHC